MSKNFSGSEIGTGRGDKGYTPAENPIWTAKMAAAAWEDIFGTTAKNAQPTSPPVNLEDEGETKTE